MNNKQNNIKENAIISANRKLTIKNSCIIGNVSIYTFKSSSNLELMVDNCALDSSEVTGTVNLKTTSLRSFINKIKLLSIGLCGSQKKRASVCLCKREPRVNHILTIERY